MCIVNAILKQNINYFKMWLISFVRFSMICFSASGVLVLRLSSICTFLSEHTKSYEYATCKIVPKLPWGQDGVGYIGVHRYVLYHGTEMIASQVMNAFYSTI